MYERTTRLLEAELGDELMTLDADAGQCFGFNSVAASVWRRLAEPIGFGQLRNALLDEYDVNPERCTEELRELMQVLIDHGLVREQRSPGRLDGSDALD